MTPMLKRSLLAAALILAASEARADSTVAAMTAASALTGPELFYCVQGSADRKCTATQLQTFIGAGTPTYPQTVAGVTTSGGVPYFSSTTVLSSSGLLTAGAPVLGGGAGGAPTSGTVSGNTTKFATVSATFATGQCLQVDASLNLATTGAACGTGGGITFPQTVAGTTNSGGIPYFSSTTVLSSSAALTANLPVIGGGAGVAPTVGSVSGTTTKFATVNTTTFATGQCVQVDASLNLTTTGSACGAGGGIVFPQTVSGTTNSGGIPYFSSATVLSSSAVLTANLPVIGGGAGVAPSVGSVSGNTTKFATVNTTTFVSGNCVQVDASSNLTTAAAACGTGGGTPGGANTNVQYNNSGAFGGSSSFTWNNATTTLSIGTGELDAGDIVASIGTITSSTPNIFSQTWNNSATTFTGLRTNITNTASASASNLIDFQINGTSFLSANTDGAVVINQRTAAISSYALQVIQTGSAIANFSAVSGLTLGQNLIFVNGVGQNISWGGQALLYEDVAFVLGQRNGTTAQSFRVYNTADAAATNPTNYERGVIDWTTTANVLTIGAQAAGTGVARSVNLQAVHHNFISGTPTANSCAGFALTTGSTDIAGKVTFTSATACSITFANAFTNAPFCVVSPGSAASTHDAVTSTTGLAVTFGTANTSMQWHCFGS